MIEIKIPIGEILDIHGITTDGYIRIIRTNEGFRIMPDGLSTIRAFYLKEEQKIENVFKIDIDLE